LTLIIGGVSGRYRGLRGHRQERAVPGAAIHWTSARPTTAGSPPIPGPEHPILGAVIGRIVSAITLRNYSRMCG
ncbi:MAG: hypothetical protein WBZ22_27605, partial [Pseudolabrys sp.]